MSSGGCRGPAPSCGGVSEMAPPDAHRVRPQSGDVLKAAVCLAAVLSGCAPMNDVSGVAASSHRSGSADSVPSDAPARANELRCPLPGDGLSIRVLIFTRSDCPISNRYAPRIHELCGLYERRGVEFTLVYPDPGETEASMQSHQAEYGLACRGVLDPEHELATAAQANVTPEAAVYDRDGRQVYRGRIDDRYVDYGRMRSEPTSDDLRDAIDACVNDRPVRAAVTEAIGCLISDLK